MRVGKLLLKKKKVLEKYSFPIVLNYLSKIIKKRKARKKEEWEDAQTLKYIRELADVLGI